uniref:Olfactory receptor family 6 subfamily Q member 1 (gene/pseudogene) n=1 Tax=Varanus komodoensis TaxID=61221 RepID=A0A8D2LIF7_VARKO
MQTPHENWTLVTEFVLVGFTGIHEGHMPLFAFFLLMYVLTLTENGFLVLAVAIEKRLHTPMYFFLIHLSCLGIWYTSLTVPKMLSGFGSLTGRMISYPACLTQLYPALPLHLLGQPRPCKLLSAGSWLVGFLTPALPVYFMSQLTFCGPSAIDHFFCDASPLLVLSCTDTSLKETVDFLVSLVVLLISCFVIVVSYVLILSTVLKMDSLVGRYRAFPTYTGHLTVVSVFYGTLFFMYVRTKVASSINFNKVVSVFYAIVTPVLNPLIYSLRKTEVKGALHRAIFKGK